MAQIKISELELNTQMSNEDVLAGVDTSEQKTKKFKLETLKTFINKEQDEQITKNKNDISANATNIETNAENISKNSENIEKNAQDIVENKENIADNTNRVKRIENTLYDSGEASGTSINIKDSTLAEFQEISVDGVCKQETTSGKNLANDNDFKGTIIGGNKSIPNISVNENEVFSITLSQTLNEIGTAGTNNDYIAQHNLKWLDENENVISQNNFLMMTFSSVGETKTLSSTGYVAPVGAKYLKLDVGSYFSNGCKIIHNYIQVEKSNVATEYEPYTGGQPSPNPSYPQEIEVIDESYELVSCAKNTFDLERLINTYKENSYYKNYVTIEKDSFSIVGKDVNTYIPAIWDGKENIATVNKKLKPNKTYTLSFESVINGEGRPSVHIVALNPNTNKYMPSIKQSSTSPITFTTGEYSDFVFRFGIMEGIDSTITYKNIQLEEGEPTPYEPYQETRVPINLPDGEFVGKINENAKDQVRLAFNEEKGKCRANLEKNFRKIVLNGSENITSNVNAPNSFYVDCVDDLKRQDPVNVLVISSHFKGISWNDRGNGETNTIYVEPYMDDVDFTIRNTPYTSVDEFKAALSEDNITIYYRLAEPYEVDLGVVDMPLSYSPETNVFTTSELEALINAKYYRNFINTIQNLQVNEKALKDELVDIQNQLKALQVNVSNLSVLATNDEVESEVVE